MVTQSPNNIHGTKSTSPPSLGPNTSPGAWLQLLYTAHRVQDCGSAQPLGCPSCPFPDCSYLFCSVSGITALERLSQPFPQLPTEIRTWTLLTITVCTTCLKRTDYTASYRLPSLNSYHCHGLRILIHLWNLSVVSRAYLLIRRQYMGDWNPTQSFVDLNLDTAFSDLDVAGDAAGTIPEWACMTFVGRSGAGLESLGAASLLGWVRSRLPGRPG